MDDLRLAFQWSNAILPTRDATDAHYYFLREPDIWSREPQELKDALVAVGRAMTDAIAIVLGNHVVQNDPAVIEGDGILPELLQHPEVAPYVASGAARMELVTPESEQELLENMLARGRGIAETGITPAARTAARANWLYAEWLKRRTAASGVPMVPSRPLDTLADRILDAAH